MTRSTPLLTTLLATFFCVACSNAATDYRPPGVVVGLADAAITADYIQERIAYLASDQMRGRDTPSPELDTAAAWIAREFQAFGLQPGLGDEWIQRYPYPLEGLDRRHARFEISAGATHHLEYGVEFFASPGHAPEQAVGAVFLGTGAGLERAVEDELRDRAAVVRLDGTPEAGRGGLRFGSEARARIQEVGAMARSAGAAAVVCIMDEAVTGAEVAALARMAEGPGRVLGGRAAAPAPATFYLTRAAALRLFRMAGLDGPELLRRESLDRPLPLPGVTVRIGAPFHTLDQARPPNVVAVLPGSDPALRDTYLVLSAHMDHVGVGRPDATGDSIYNGADDNASGTAALMAVSRAFASLPTPPRRSVIFLAVSGEEKGLLGSRWYAENPTVPIERIVANINIDMIGRNAPDSIVVIGKEYSSLGAVVREVARAHPQLRLTASRDLWPDQRFFFRSDHFNFAAKEIPAIFFFAGTHDDYHRPSDQVHRIDFDKTARVARLVFLVAHRIADTEQPPAWDPAGLEQVRSLTRR